MPPKTPPKPRRDLGELLLDRGSDGLPLRLVATKDDASLKDLTAAQRAWMEARSWQPKAGSVLLLSDENGAIAGALLGTGGEDWATQSPLLPGALPGALPTGDYRFVGKLPDPELATLAWLAGCYRFGRYKSEANGKPKRLVLPEGVDRARVLALAEALYLGRDLINTPANDLGPAELEAAARELATEHGAEVKVTEGSSLLSDNFPMIHAVGRASDRAPRLIDLHWGSAHAPKVTIVGKGICFDTGGLDIKPGSAMALMKKDMGGAATALTLAHLIMSRKLPVRLRVLIPAADNSIAGNAFRPGDVLESRNGMTVEIGNTDAEGRLVLADALSLADEEAPDYLITIATLTGAARVALGPDLPPLFSDDEDLAAGLLAIELQRRRSVVAAAVLGALRQAAQEQHRRCEPHRRRRPCRLGDGGAVPQALRHQGQALRPSRHLRLGAARAAGATARRRAPSRARPVRLFRERARAVINGVLPDPRRHAYREDLAAASLRDHVKAPRYVTGEERQLVVPVLPLRRQPRFDATLDTEALFGETLTLLEEREGWAWVQLARDGYVGYMPSEGLSAAVRTPTHKVAALRTYVYPEPDFKRPPLALLSMNALAFGRRGRRQVPGARGRRLCRRHAHAQGR